MKINIVLYMKNIIICTLCLLLISCEKEECRVCSDGVTRCGRDYDEWLKSPKITQLDKLFLNGFQMELKQIYIMPGKNSIPIYDTPADSCFKGNNTITNLRNYQTTSKDFMFSF